MTDHRPSNPGDAYRPMVRSRAYWDAKRKAEIAWWKDTTNRLAGEYAKARLELLELREKHQ